MIIKTKNLTDDALFYAVTLCSEMIKQGATPGDDPQVDEFTRHKSLKEFRSNGPKIDEAVAALSLCDATLSFHSSSEDLVAAVITQHGFCDEQAAKEEGATTELAICRVFVSYCLGDEVDIPNELLPQGWFQPEA